MNTRSKTRNVLPSSASSSSNSLRNYTLNGTPEKLLKAGDSANGNERNSKCQSLNSNNFPSSSMIISMSTANQRILERTTTREIITTTDRIIESTTSVMSFENKKY